MTGRSPPTTTSVVPGDEDDPLESAGDGDCVMAVAESFVAGAALVRPPEEQATSSAADRARIAREFTRARFWHWHVSRFLVLGSSGEVVSPGAAERLERSSSSQAWSIRWWAMRRMRNASGHVRADRPAAW